MVHCDGFARATIDSGDSARQLAGPTQESHDFTQRTEGSDLPNRGRRELFLMASKIRPA